MEIVQLRVDCPPPADACLNRAIEAILDPNFDSAGFDDVLRTIDFELMIDPDPNTVSVDLLVRISTRPPLSSLLCSRGAQSVLARFVCRRRERGSARPQLALARFPLASRRAGSPAS